jgi:hypothetical protein
MSYDASGKVATLEELAHRYGGLSRPRRSLARDQDFSKVSYRWSRAGTTLLLSSIERSSTIL